MYDYIHHLLDTMTDAVTLQERERISTNALINEKTYVPAHKATVVAPMGRTPPESPKLGDLWYNTNAGRMFAFTGEWRPVS